MRFILKLSDLATIRQCLDNPMLVPIVVDGSVQPIRASMLTWMSLRTPLSVEDHVKGLEALGWSVDIDSDGNIRSNEPEVPIPLEWQLHAQRLHSEFSYDSLDEATAI